MQETKVKNTKRPKQITSKDNFVRKKYYICSIKQVLIVGNGGVKSTKTYEEDDDLNGYVISLQKLDELLRADIKNGTVRIEKTEIIGTDDKEYDL